MACDSASVKIELVEEYQRPAHCEIEPAPEFVGIKLEARDDESSMDENVPDVSRVKVEAGKVKASPGSSQIPPQDGARDTVQPPTTDMFIISKNREDDGEQSTPSGDGAGAGACKCPTCEQCFDSVSGLDSHASGAVRCGSCGRGFQSCAALLSHRHACKSAVKFVCDVCEKVFPRAHLLRSHSMRHSTERPHECPECPARFKVFSTLTRHRALHQGLRPHACPHCDKTFTSKGLLKPHLRSHTGEKPFECPQCLKKFAHKHNMQRHQLRHNKVKHLVCHVCKKQFPKESHLKYHMRCHATDKRPFQCLRCDKSFSHRRNILRHYSRFHAPHQYPIPDTDASRASEVWNTMMGSLDTVPTEILPL